MKDFFLQFIVTEKGYGSGASKDSLANTFAKFYGLSNLPSHEEGKALAMSKDSGTKLWNSLLLR